MMSPIQHRVAWCALLVGLACAHSGRADPTNLVANGSFESAAPQAGKPDFWSAAGDPAVVQELTLDLARDGRHCARLECRAFGGDGPVHHAMLCQVGRVGVRKSRWYQLTFWARTERLKAGAVEVALVNTRQWQDAGLADAFIPGPQWSRFEMRFRATQDLPAEVSRLQFWHKGTGTLWLDDVVLVESALVQEWFPQVPPGAGRNLVPNSSFECDGANWGSLSYQLVGWAGNLYRLEAAVDDRMAAHGRQSLRISLAPATLPVFYFDYYEPVRQPVRRVLAANHGWFRVEPGAPLTLSAFLRADAEGVVAQLALNESPAGLDRRTIRVGPTWRRYEATFRPVEPFVFVAVGLDLEETRGESATLWVDAVQLERGERLTDYAPRSPLESFVQAAVAGNIFTNTDEGLALTVLAYNDGDAPQNLHGECVATDFDDRVVWKVAPDLPVPPHSGQQMPLRRILPGREGFFRVDWRTGEVVQGLRCALIQPPARGDGDSPFGLNHAYPWDFLVGLAHTAGIGWWRDWSAQWQIVEPARGQFAFDVPDAQIGRVRGLGGQVIALLPFPSASWSTSARRDEAEKAAGNNRYLRDRLPLAYPPRDLEDFGRYAAEVIRHYGQPEAGGLTTCQVLNEPVYTDYALPRQFGYSLDDYLRLLRVAYRSLKGAAPTCRVVGGISAGLAEGLTREFVTRGGLDCVDVLDLHIYDPARPAESYAEAFASLESLLRAHGGPKPVWVTEWGCYADDDPACVPGAVGDATMNRCCWPSEHAATEHLVKFAAVSFSHGVRKLFFHSGTCGQINGPDAGGVLFEYGGAPRRMLPGVAAFTRLVGVPEESLGMIENGSLRACLFRAHGRVVAVAWLSEGAPRPLTLAEGAQAWDIMGNQLQPGSARLSRSPVYVVGKDANVVRQAFLGDF